MAQKLRIFLSDPCTVISASCFDVMILSDFQVPASLMLDSSPSRISLIAARDDADLAVEVADRTIGCHNLTAITPEPKTSFRQWVRPKT